MRQAVTPMISYENAAEALPWLAEAFGFRETTRIAMPDGGIGHAEMETEGGGMVMLAQPTPEYRSPARHGKDCAEAAAWLAVPYVIDGVHVYVPDLDAHFARAEAAGATILGAPEDTPFGRLYRAADLEGHRWMFEQLPDKQA